MGKFTLALLTTLAAVNSVASADYPAPNPTYDAQQYTTWSDKTVGKSRKAKVYVPFTAADGSQDMISIYRLDLVGNDYERGYAHGYLLAKGTPTYFCLGRTCIKLLTLSLCNFHQKLSSSRDLS